MKLYYTSSCSNNIHHYTGTSTKVAHEMCFYCSHYEGGLKRLVVYRINFVIIAQTKIHIKVDIILGIEYNTEDAILSITAFTAIHFLYRYRLGI